MFGKRIKVREIGGNLTLTIPRDVGDHFNIAKGDSIDVYCYDQKLVVDLMSIERSKLFDSPTKVQEVEAA
jgi:antitoxin component of MazEF toxin-antitoxin module